MAAKTWTSPPNSGVDELLFRNDTVSLCLLVNRRHRTLRIIDFRAGLTPSKRDFVVSTAKREGVEKIFTLVERDEVSTWTRLGFLREGSIPGFYKRSDAWILGAVVSRMAAPIATYAAEDDEDDDGADEESGERVVMTSPAVSLADRTLARAKRILKDSPQKPPPAVRLAPADDSDLRRAVASAQRRGRALAGFEQFGRDAVRVGYKLSTRGGFTLHAFWEMQACFGNACLELLTAPRTDPERMAATAAVRVLCDRLIEEKVVSVFTFAPSDNAALAAVFLANGFRRSAVLASHLAVGAERKDAILWSKKLCTPEA